MIKKITKKCRYFPKNVVDFRFFSNEMECEKDKQGFKGLKYIISLVYFNYYKGKSAKEIADVFSLKIITVYTSNIISRAEKEGRLDLKGSTGRP